MKGLFITIEGPEGSGKTTVAKKISVQLANDGYPAFYTREPGGVEIAEKIRDIILDVKNTKLDSRCEALLYAASRRQHLVEKVEPALAAGKVIICDRFLDSSLAYQGYARGLGIDEVFQVNMFAINNRLPDLTVLLDIDPEVGLERIAKGRKEEMNRLDLEGLNFHKLVHQGYEIIKNKYPDRFTIINGNNNPDQVFADVYHVIKNFIDSNT